MSIWATATLLLIVSQQTQSNFHEIVEWKVITMTHLLPEHLTGGSHSSVAEAVVHSVSVFDNEDVGTTIVQNNRNHSLNNTLSHPGRTESSGRIQCPLQILRSQCLGTVKWLTDTDSTVLRYSQTSDIYWQHSAELQSNKWQTLTAQCWGSVKWLTDTDSTVLRYCQMNDRHWQQSAEVLSNKWQLPGAECWSTDKEVTVVKLTLAILTSNSV